MTDKEKAEFETMATDGRLGNLVEVWTPWWQVKVCGNSIFTKPTGTSYKFDKI